MTFQPKRAIIYQWLHDKFPERTIAEKIALFKELNVDTIFRAFWYCPFPHCPKTDTIVQYYTDVEWSEMENVVYQIHAAIPAIKIIACLGPRIPSRWNDNSTIKLYQDKNYTTNTIYTTDRVYNMILDPRKWGLMQIREDAYKALGKTSLAVADFTNTDCYNILLSRAKMYIDIGCDGVWFDELHKSTYYLKGLTGDANHPAVVETYNATVNIINDIRNYFISQKKESIIGTWMPPVGWFPDNIPKLEFITLNKGRFDLLSGYEMVNPIITDDSIMSGYRSQVKGQHRRWYGNDIISLFFIDDPTILGTFVQCLNSNRQKAKLKELKEICNNIGMAFAYPVHGQWISEATNPRRLCQDVLPNSLKKSYGLYDYYDAKAPEFQTYDTIRELINPTK